MGGGGGVREGDWRHNMPSCKDKIAGGGGGVE